jgi:hypothetical protein
LSAGVGRVSGLPSLAWTGFVAAVTIALAATASVARQLVGPFEAARVTDASHSLKERIATALELLDTGARGEVVDRQLQDARASLLRIAPGQAFPAFAVENGARRKAVRQLTAGVLLLAAALGLALWPAAQGAHVADADAERLVLADPGRHEELLQRPLVPEQNQFDGAEVQGRSSQPQDVGDLSGLVGENQQASQPQPGAVSQPASGQPGDQAQRDAQNQQSASTLERQEALRDLGAALRQSQTGRAAGDSLQRGDTQRASQQLAQVADQVQRLSPGERQSLSQALSEAARQIGTKDQALADAARRAGAATSEFRNQEAQNAIRDLASQVNEIGREAEAQRNLAQRAQQMQQGGQPQLPPGLQNPQDQSGLGSQPGDQRAGSQASTQPPRQGGDGGDAGDLSGLEAALRGSGLRGVSGGEGAGGADGTKQEGTAQRLNAEGRLVQVQAEVGEGPSQWRPPNPGAAPAAPPPAAAPLPGAAPSTVEVRTGVDLNSVPWELANSVRQYFTPEQRP